VPSETETWTLPHLSHSTVDSYSRCGEAFRLAKVEKVDSEPSWALVAGSAIHMATETLDYRDFGIETGQPDNFVEALEVVLEEQRARGFEESVIRTTGRKSREWPSARNKDYWLQNGQAHITRWRNYLSTGVDVAIINGRPAIEVEFLVMLEAEDGTQVPFKGFIDRIIESSAYGAGIIDLKTGASAPESDTQLREYNLAVALMGDIEIKWAAYYCTDEKLGGLTLPVPLEARTDAQVKAPVLMAWKGIHAGIFMPNIGRHCSSCFVRKHCTYWD
jgi:putative RecB family exonuclease